MKKEFIGYKEFFVKYRYGIHHIKIKTDKEDLKRILSDMEKEFEINIEYSQDIIKNDIYHIYIKKEYCIINYYGDKEIIAYELYQIPTENDYEIYD